MHYRKLVAGINAYASEGETTIDEFPKEVYVEEAKYFLAFDQKTPMIERAKIIINKWGKCRVHIYDKKLRNALRAFNKKYKSVLDWKLSELLLWEQHDTIVEIFNNFVDVLKYTGTSKLLHILNPEFFMIWDVKVRHRYGCSENADGYFNFLYRSQKEIKEMLNSYKEDYRKISQRIYEGKTKAILKLLDEYNYAYEKGWIKG